MVETIHVGQKMLAVAEKLPDKSLYLRMSSIPNSADAVANDTQYHKTCWVYAERSIQQGVETDEKTPRDNDSIIADIEIVEVVRSNILQNKKVCMNDINKTYNNLVGNSEQEKNL